MRSSGRLTGVAVAVAVAGGLGACDELGPDRGSGGSSESAPVAVTRGTLEEHLLLTGELEAAESDDLLAPQTENWGISIRWLVEDGADVEQGSRVVELDNTAILETIRDLDLAVVQAGNELASQRAASVIELEDKRFEVLSQRTALAKALIDAEVSPELISRREYQQFQLAVRTARTALATAEDDLKAAERGARLEEEVKRIALRKAERQFQSAEEQLGSLVLTAPRDGVAVVGTHPWEGRKLQLGDTVWPGLTVAKLPDLSSLVVEAVLSDVDDGRIRPGMTASCVIDAHPDRPIDARVVSVSPVAREPEHQSARRFFSVMLELEPTELENLRPGLSVKVNVNVARHEGAVLVPRDALDLSTEPARVWRTSGEPVDVELGACDPHHCVVLAGLDEGASLRRGPGEEAAG